MKEKWYKCYFIKNFDGFIANEKDYKSPFFLILNRTEIDRFNSLSCNIIRMLNKLIQIIMSIV